MTCLKDLPEDCIQEGMQVMPNDKFYFTRQFVRDNPLPWRIKRRVDRWSVELDIRNKPKESNANEMNVWALDYLNIYYPSPP